MRKLNAIPAVITLIAGVITCIISMRNQYSVTNTLILILTVLVIFYVLGLIAKSIIAGIVKKMEETEKERMEAERLIKEQQEDATQVVPDLSNE